MEESEISDTGAIILGKKVTMERMLTYEWLERAENLVLGRRTPFQVTVNCGDAPRDAVSCRPWCNRLFRHQLFLRPLGKLLEEYEENADLKEKTNQLRHILQEFCIKLRFMFLATQPPLLTDLTIKSHNIKKLNPSFRETLYYATMHEWDNEMYTMVLQIFYYSLVSLPFICFMVVFDITTRDVNWGLNPPPEGTTVTAMRWIILCYGIPAWCAMLVYNLIGFGDKHEPAEFDRSIWPFWKVRTESELVKAGYNDRGKAVPAHNCLGDWGAMLNILSCGLCNQQGPDSESRQNGRQQETPGFFQGCCDWCIIWLCGEDNRNDTVKEFSSQLRYYRLVNMLGEMWNVLSGIFFLVYVWFTVVMAMWIVLGIFVYPAKFLPWATAVIGLVTHVITLTRRLTGMKDRIEAELTKQIEDILRNDIADQFNVVAETINDVAGSKFVPDADSLIDMGKQAAGFQTKAAAVGGTLMAASRAAAALPAQISECMAEATKRLDDLAKVDMASAIMDSMNENDKSVLEAAFVEKQNEVSDHISAIVSHIEKAVSLLESMQEQLKVEKTLP